METQKTLQTPDELVRNGLFTCRNMERARWSNAKVISEDGPPPYKTCITYIYKTYIYKTLQCLMYEQKKHRDKETPQHITQVYTSQFSSSLKPSYILGNAGIITVIIIIVIMFKFGNSLFKVHNKYVVVVVYIFEPLCRCLTCVYQKKKSKINGNLCTQLQIFYCDVECKIYIHVFYG